MELLGIMRINVIFIGTLSCSNTFYDDSFHLNDLFLLIMLKVMLTFHKLQQINHQP